MSNHIGSHSTGIVKLAVAGPRAGPSVGLDGPTQMDDFSIRTGLRDPNDRLALRISASLGRRSSATQAVARFPDVVSQEEFRPTSS